MNELISRSAVIDVLSARPYLAELIQNLPAVRPQVVANISGGVLQGASSDYPVDLYTLDFEDVPRDDPENVIEVEGSEAFLGQCSTLIDPDFVEEVVSA